MSAETIIDQGYLQQWVNQNLDQKAIEDQLQQKGFDHAVIASYVKAYRKLRNSKKQFNGFLFAGLGAFLGFLSCVLSIINPVPELYTTFLFGLTSIAILLACYGLYLLFE